MRIVERSEAAEGLDGSDSDADRTPGLCGSQRVSMGNARWVNIARLRRRRAVDLNAKPVPATGRVGIGWAIGGGRDKRRTGDGFIQPSPDERGSSVRFLRRGFS